MTDNTFDKFVRDKLRDHQSPVPPGLWEKIERKKDKDPKGGFFLPKNALWAGLFIIAASVGIGYFVWRDDGSKNNISQVKENTVAAKNNGGDNVAGTGSSENAGKQDDETGTANDQSNTNTNANTNSNAASSNNNIVKNNIDNSVANNNNTAHQEKADPNTTPNNIKANNISSDHDIALNRYDDDIQDGTSAVVKAGRKNTAIKNTGGIKKKKTVFTEPDLSKVDQDAIPSVDEDLYQKFSFAQGTTAYTLKNFSGGLNLNLSDFKNCLATPCYGRCATLKIPGIDCPPRGNEPRNDWYLEVYGSPDIVMKSVKSNNNSVFVSKKDSTESQQLSYTAGFRISKSIGENLLIKTGLQYSQINERFDLRTENERRIITVVTIRTVIGSSGADSTISDTSTVEQIGYRLQRSYNRYRSIDIPLLLSYEFGKENLKFAVNAGAIINLYSWYSGNTINDSLAVVSLHSKGSGVYKQNIGVGVYAGFSIMKPVSPKFDVFLEPYFRYNFSNMSRSAGYSQRFNAMGINLGIRYKLKGRQRSGMN